MNTTEWTLQSWCAPSQVPNMFKENCKLVGASVHALSTSNGASIWNATLGGAVVSTPCLVLQGTFVIVTARDGVVYKLDANHGFVSWRDQTDAAITASPLLLDDENVVVV